MENLTLRYEGESSWVQDEHIVGESGLEENRAAAAYTLIRSLISRISDGIKPGGSLIHLLRKEW